MGIISNSPPESFDPDVQACQVSLALVIKSVSQSVQACISSRLAICLCLARGTEIHSWITANTQMMRLCGFTFWYSWVGREMVWSDFLPLHLLPIISTSGNLAVSPLNFQLIAYKIQLLNSWGLWFYVVEKSYKEDISSLFTLGQLYDH